MRKKLGERTLKELREQIEEESQYVDIKPYSHNIISLTLAQIYRRFGRRAANRAIRDFGLNDLGWSERTEKDDKE